MFEKKSEIQILGWIKKSEYDSFGQYLVSGTVHGQPGVPVGELVRLRKILRKNFADEQLFKIGQKLLQRPEYTSRRIGVSLIAHGWPQFKEVEGLIKKTADDEDWQVRETAAGVFATLLEKDFRHFSKLYKKWVHEKSVNVKRAIALAVKYESKPEDPKKVKTYFDLIDPLMCEEAEYIRKNLGPFAIGDGLLSRFPKETIQASYKWSKSNNENVKWNTAMIFTAAAAKKYSKDGQKILSLLAKDESPFVSKAAKKALISLKKD